MRKRGVGRTSVAQVMRASGLTHGGFYRHFKTKDALVSAALGSAFRDLNELLASEFEARDPALAAEAVMNFYLSKEHVANPEKGCPIPALGAEVARGSKHLKAEFGDGVKTLISGLARGMEGTSGEKVRKAACALAALAGAVMIARACDRDTGRFVLEACRQELAGASKSKRQRGAASLDAAS